MPHLLVKIMVASLVGLLMHARAAPAPVSSSPVALHEYISNSHIEDRLDRHFMARYHDDVPDEVIDEHIRQLEAMIREHSWTSATMPTMSATLVKIGSWRAVDLRVEHELIPEIAKCPLVGWEGRE